METKATPDELSAVVATCENCADPWGSDSDGDCNLFFALGVGDRIERERESTILSYTDADRAAFLNALDMADFEVTDWEAQFLESNTERASFSPKQREAIDGMIERYGERVKF